MRTVSAKGQSARYPVIQEVIRVNNSVTDKGITPDDLKRCDALPTEGRITGLIGWKVCRTFTVMPRKVPGGLVKGRTITRSSATKIDGKWYWRYTTKRDEKLPPPRKI